MKTNQVIFIHFDYFLKFMMTCLIIIDGASIKVEENSGHSNEICTIKMTK